MTSAITPPSTEFTEGRELVSRSRLTSSMDAAPIVSTHKANQKGNQGANHSSRKRTPASSTIMQIPLATRVPSMIAARFLVEMLTIGPANVASPVSTVVQRGQHRTRILLYSGQSPLARGCGKAAKFAFAGRIGGTRLHEVVFAKVGPECGRDP